MKIFLTGLIRGVIPIIFLLIISLWSEFQGSEVNSKIFFYYGLIAFFLGFASVIYQIRQWSFLKQILVHYMAMLITVFPTLLLSDFYPLNSFGDVLKVYLLFNKVGIILFLITYFISKLLIMHHDRKSKMVL